MTERRATGRASVELPMEEWDWDNLTELQKVVDGQAGPADLDAVAEEVRKDPSLARFRWGESQWTLLHVAANEWHEPLVRALIEAGADVNAVSIDGTPLREAGGNVRLLELLLAAGANPNIPDHRGCTPLYGALLNHDIEAAKFLMAHGATPKDEYSRNAVRQLQEAGLR